MMKLNKLNLPKVQIALLVILFSLVQLDLHAQFNVHSFANHIDTIKDEKKKTSSFLYVAEYYALNKPDSSYHYASIALKHALQLNDSSLISDSYKFLGISLAEKLRCEESDSILMLGLHLTPNRQKRAMYLSDMGASFSMCGKLTDAFLCFKESKKLYKEDNDIESLTSLLINMGVTYSRTSQYYKASTSYHEALDICEQVNDEASIAVIYQNLGEVMALQNQYDKAVGYYNSALEKFKEQDRQKNMAAAYLNLGQIYIELEEWDIAKSYLNKSYVIDTTLKLINFESIALKQLGITYLKVNKLESAEKLVRAALYLQEKYKYHTLAPESRYILANILFEKGEYTETLKVLNKAKLGAEQLKDDLLKAKVLLLMSQTLEKKNNYQLAYPLLAESNRLRDSIFNLEKINSIMNLELAYQTEIKEKQIDELKFKDSLQQQKIKNKSSQVYLLIVSLILLFVVLLSIIISRRRRHQMEAQQREQKFLKGRFEAEEKAKDKIATELHDDIGGQMIGLILQLESSDKLNKTELDQLRKAYQGVRRLSHSLDEPLFNEIMLQERIKNYLSELKSQVEFRIPFIDDLNIDWLHIKDHKELQRNIYRIIQELITNTSKYAEAKDVELQLINDQENITIIYEDDGIGMDLTQKKTSPNFNTIKKRIEMFNGSLEVNTEPGKGFFISIGLPFKRQKHFN